MFDSLCEEFGMSTNTSFNIYVRQVIRSRRIPFAIEAPAKDDIMKFRLDFFGKKVLPCRISMQNANKLKLFNI